MFRILAILMVTIFWSNLSFAYRLGEKEIKILKKSIASLCKTTNNSHIKISNTGNTKTVLLKNLVEMDFSGTATFSKTEWARIASLLPSKSGATNSVKCEAEVTPIFTDKFSKQYEEETDIDM